MTSNYDKVSELFTDLPDFGELSDPVPATLQGAQVAATLAVADALAAHQATLKEIGEQLAAGLKKVSDAMNASSSAMALGDIPPRHIVTDEPPVRRRDAFDRLHPRLRELILCAERWANTPTDDLAQDLRAAVEVWRLIGRPA